MTAKRKRLQSRAIHRAEERTVKRILRELRIEEKYYEKFHDEVNRWVQEEGKKSHNQIRNYVNELKNLFGK